MDGARACAILAVVLGHWLVVDLRRGVDGGLVATDVLARLPDLQHLSWPFQVMPVFFFAGGTVAFRSWRRHAATGATAAAWVAGRLWRLLWPTAVVTVFWVLVSQVGRHLMDVEPSVLDATRGIALVIWFLAAYATEVALVPAFEWGCRRVGAAVPVALASMAVVVDLAASATGYESSTRPSWVWVNYLTVWGVVVCLGRWWPTTPRPEDRRRGLALVGVAGAVLVGVTTLDWYPVSMVGVTGVARSNTLPPTVALLSLALVQIGGLVVVRPTLDRWLASDRVYGVVGAVGARAMTIYLWHLLAVAVLAVGAVLPGWWPSSEIGSVSWWSLRLAWVVAAAAITLPVVVLAARVERPPALRLSTHPVAVGSAVVLAVLGWAALAIAGFHPVAMPAGLPLVALGGLGASIVLLVAT